MNSTHTTKAGERTHLKEVGYAYPSSDLATKQGKGKTGCWIVRTFDSKLRIAPITLIGNGFDTKEAAFSAADSLPYPYGRYSMKRD